jgi:hypothetical protein
VPLSGEQNLESSVNWLAVGRTLLVQVVVLLVLTGAVAFYLRWSSDANWEDFLAASRSSVADPGERAQSPAPVQTVKRGATCNRKS